MAYAEPERQMVNPIKNNGVQSDKMAGFIVVGALVALVAIHRGFRGVSVSGATGGLVRP